MSIDLEQVTQEVQEEIKNLGANSKKNHEELNRNVKKMQETIDKNSGRIDSFDAKKIDRLAEDAVTRQEAVDLKFQETEAQEKAVNDRMDQVEVFLQKLPSELVSSKNIGDLEKEAKSFFISHAASKGQGITVDQLNALDINTEQYKGYKDTFLRYLRKGDRELDLPETKLLMVGSDADGGYTVSPTISNRVVERLYELDPIRALAGTQTISTDSFEMPVDWDEAGAEWVSETIPATNETTPTMDKKRIVAHELATRPKVTQRILEDSAINIETYLANKIADKFSRVESAAFVTGNGTGKPTGFLSLDNGTDYGQVEQINMGAAAALTTDGLIDIKFALLEYYMERGTWLMSRTTVREIMKLKDGNGNYIWDTNLVTSGPSMLLGLPVRMSTSMPAVAANALSVVLADWKEAYLIVDRLGISTLRNPYRVPPFIEYYTRKRVGGDVINGQAIKIGKISV